MWVPRNHVHSEAGGSHRSGDHPVHPRPGSRCPGGKQPACPLSQGPGSAAPFPSPPRDGPELFLQDSLAEGSGLGLRSAESLGPRAQGGR